MSSKIQKWGNSLGIRIPKSIIEKTQLNENTEVEIEHRDGVIIIFPSKKKYDLESLVSKITSENLHKAEGFKPKGKEVW